MKDNTSSARAEKTSLFPFPYFAIRHITSPEDSLNDRRIYVGQAPLSSILELDADENVREYLLESRKKRVPSQVHRAIQETLQNRPEDFSVLNSGIVLVARECEVDDKHKTARLLKPSIINGSQTQGIVRDYYKKRTGQIPLFSDDTEPHVKFEIIVTTDEDLIANISIARNFQNDVMAISIAGRLKQLDELEESFRRTHPDLVLRKSETDVPYDDNNVVDTERLIQVIAALVPDELWLKGGEVNKVYTYSQKTKCLREFQEIYKIVKGQEAHPLHSKYVELYQFYIDIAGEAHCLYEKWKKHPGFKGSGLRAIRRNDRGEIEEVPDGIVFPVLSSLSAFATHDRDGWTITVPPIDNELIQAAKSSYIEVARSNPNVMGKSKACYSALGQITSIVRKYSMAMASS